MSCWVRSLLITRTSLAIDSLKTSRNNDHMFISFPSQILPSPSFPAHHLANSCLSLKAQVALAFPSLNPWAELRGSRGRGGGCPLFPLPLIHTQVTGFAMSHLLSPHGTPVVCVPPTRWQVSLEQVLYFVIFTPHTGHSSWHMVVMRITRANILQNHYGQWLWPRN